MTALLRLSSFLAIVGRARLSALLALVVLLAAVTAGPAWADPQFPALTGRVVDDAGLLSPQDRQTLTGELEALEQKTGAQLVVVTLPALQGYEIEEFGYRLGRAWGIGQAGKDNGVLLIVAPKERRVRIEVGRGLEPELTDAATRLIIENGITPKFRAGDFVGGIRTGVRDIVGVISGDEATLQNLKSAGKPGEADTLFVTIVWLVILLVIIWIMWRSSRPGARGGRAGPVIFVPGAGSGGGWDSGGGGFSGGGGDFGGGGASGSW